MPNGMYCNFRTENAMTPGTVYDYLSVMQYPDTVSYPLIYEQW